MGEAVDRLIYLTHVKAHTKVVKGKTVQVAAYDTHGNAYLHFNPVDVAVSRHVMSRAFRKELKAEADSPGAWKGLAAFHEDTPNGNVVTVARDKTGRVIGAIEYFHYQGDAFVKSLHVEKTTQTKGVGTYLMQKVAQELLTRPKGHIRNLYVSGALVSAQPFYERLGGTTLYPAQVKALAEGNPITESGGGTGMGTYEERLKAHSAAWDGDVAAAWPENAKRWRSISHG